LDDEDEPPKPEKRGEEEEEEENLFDLRFEDDADASAATASSPELLGGTADWPPSGCTLPLLPLRLILVQDKKGIHDMPAALGQRTRGSTPQRTTGSR
jgi:hypothetical protein